MKILIACEESQAVCIAFRKAGHEAYSCDTLPCSGGHPEWHIQDDVLSQINKGWDMMIAFPPCTFLTVTGNKWMKPEFADRFPTRIQDRKDAIEFFMTLINAPIEKIAIENPVGIMSTQFRKPDQYVHPYYFGDPHSKKTGLWLKNLPKLQPTKMVEPEFYIYKDGRRDPMWHVETMSLPKAERTKARSKTYPGVAKVMADQWGLRTNKTNTMGTQTEIISELQLGSSHITHLIGSAALKEDLIALRADFEMGKTEAIPMSRLKIAFPEHDWEAMINRHRRIFQSQTMAGKVFNCKTCVRRGRFCNTHSFYEQILKPEEVARFVESHKWKHHSTGNHEKSKCPCGE